MKNAAKLKRDFVSSDTFNKTVIDSRIRRLLLAGVGALLLAATLVPGFTSFGQEEQPGWSDPIALSTRLPSSWFPDIVVDDTGIVHVVWATVSGAPRVSTAQTEREGHDVVMYSSSGDGTEWTDPVDIIAIPQESGSHATRPELQVDEAGIAHMTFRTDTVFYSQAPLRLIEDPKVWSSPRQISIGNVAYYSALAMDREGAIHAVFTQNVPTSDCAFCFHLLYRRSDDGGLTWSPINDVSLLPTGTAKPQILIDQNDKIHLIWESGRGGGLGLLEAPVTVNYASSEDGGDSWSLPLEFPAPNGQARNIAIAESGSGELIITWLSLPDKRVHYQTSIDGGQSWSRARVIEEFQGHDAGLDSYTMAADSAGNVHFVFVGRSLDYRAGQQLIHLVWTPLDGAWVEAQIIAAYRGDVPEWPRLTVSGGNHLHLVWYVRDRYHVFDSDNGRYQVWYAHTEVDAPPKGLSIEPSETAMPIPTPTATTVPPTPRPTLDPSIADFGSEVPPIDNETAALTLLVKSLAPAILLLGAVAIGIRLWRR